MFSGGVFFQTVFEQCKLAGGKEEDVPFLILTNPYQTLQ